MSENKSWLGRRSVNGKACDSRVPRRTCGDSNPAQKEVRERCDELEFRQVCDQRILAARARSAHKCS